MMVKGPRPKSQWVKLLIPVADMSTSAYVTSSHRIDTMGCVRMLMIDVKNLEAVSRYRAARSVQHTLPLLHCDQHVYFSAGRCGQRHVSR